MYLEVRRLFRLAYFYIIYGKLVTVLIHSCCSMAGKCNRGLSVVDSYKLLKGADVLGEEEMFLACTLGWCIEWVMFDFSLPASSVVLRTIANCKATRADPDLFCIYSFKLSFWCLMTSWMSPTLAEASHVGSGCLRLVKQNSKYSACPLCSNFHADLFPILVC